MRTVRCGTAAALAVLLATWATTAVAIVIPNITLTLAPSNASYNTLNLTIDLQPTGLPNEGQSNQSGAAGNCSATVSALFDPNSHVATAADITFNLEPGQISLANMLFAYSWSGIKENLNTSSDVFSPYTAAPPSPVSGGLFAANQQAAAFNGGNLIYSGVVNQTQNLASTPIDAPNTATGSGTIAISSPVMNGNVATYSATVSTPLSVNQPISGTDYTGTLLASGAIAMSGTFQFDFGPRTVNWNAATGDFSSASNWDVGFAPRSADTAAIPSGASTLSKVYTGSPSAVWVGDGAATSGTLNLAAGSSLTCGAMVLGQSSGAGTLIVHGGTLSAAAIVKGAGGAGTLYFNGGTLRATADSNDFVTGLSAFYVSAGGATIDSEGFDISIAQSLRHDPALGTTPDGGLVKTGSGTLTLDGADTYTGGTTVADGVLVIAASAALPEGTGLVVGANASSIFTDAEVGSQIASLTTTTAVPEPSAGRALLAVAIGGVAVYLRMAHRST